MKIIICADDYGYNDAVSQAIIHLIKKGCLSATSCLTTSPSWSEYAAWLAPYKNQVDIGLHVNLTEGQPLSAALQDAHGFLPLSQCLARAYLGLLNKKAIEIEIETQLAAFEQSFQQLPDFIDGHQHVHQLPIVREVILKIYAKHLQNSGCYMRSTYQPLALSGPAFCKRMIIQLAGARQFKKLLIEQKIPHNSLFAGIYSFITHIPYADIFPQFLVRMRSGGLIMCHPSMAKEVKDTIGQQRLQEFSYFDSDHFLEQIARHQLKISRFKNI